MNIEPYIALRFISDILDNFDLALGSNPEIRHFFVVREIVVMYVVYALTRLYQHARFRQQQQQQHMHLQAIDICSMHAKREDTSEHPVDLSALKFKIKVPN